MSKERIGKLERWILIHAYLKLKGQLPEHWKERGHKRWRPDKERHWAEREIDGLSKAEVIANYYDVEWKHLRSLTKGYRKAQVSYGRAIKKLVAKGLIILRGVNYRGEIWIQDQSEDWIYSSLIHGIILTDSGIRKAEKYLNVNRSATGTSINNKAIVA